jgi:N-acetylglutamate synthase-like GNAT family acetyltransferase
VIACGQVKQHGGGVLELASIAVKQPYRGRGAARAIIERLLLANPRPLLLMCRSSLGSMYEQFGFRPLAYDAMPRYFQRVSKLAGVAEALARSSEQLLVMKLE